MIEVNNVSKNYGPTVAVSNVSFTVNNGQIMGLLGPNGAGKTTIIKILTGYHYPSSGEVKINGLDIIRDNIAIKKSLGYLPENAPLYQDLRVSEYLDFICKVRFKDKDEANFLLNKVLDDCEIRDVYNKPISSLSKGYKQRVGFAQAIIHSPDILILDEPTTGLDPNQIQEMRKLIKKLGKSKTVILSTHIMQEVNAMCDSVVILSKGKVALQGKKDYIQSNIEKEDIFDVTLKVPPEFERDDFNHELPDLKKFEIISKTNLKSKDNLDNTSDVSNSNESTSDVGSIIEVKLRFPPRQSWQQNAESIYDFSIKNKIKILSLTRIKVDLEEVFSNLTQLDEKVQSEKESDKISEKT